MKNLPQEIQNKIFYYHAEHPTARIIKQEINNLFNDYKQRYYKYITINNILFETFQQFFMNIISVSLLFNLAILLNLDHLDVIVVVVIMYIYNSNFL
mgnify:CR=1 FL=1